MKFTKPKFNLPYYTITLLFIILIFSFLYHTYRTQIGEYGSQNTKKHLPKNIINPTDSIFANNLSIYASEDFVGFPATCFAPDTDPSVIEDFYEYKSVLTNSLGISNTDPLAKFNLVNRSNG